MYFQSIYAYPEYPPHYGPIYEWAIIDVEVFSKMEAKPLTEAN